MRVGRKMKDAIAPLQGLENAGSVQNVAAEEPDSFLIAKPGLRGAATQKVDGFTMPKQERHKTGTDEPRPAGD